jgi:hypothetical protein
VARSIRHTRRPQILVALASRTSLSRPDGDVPAEIRRRILNSLDTVATFMYGKLPPADQCNARQRMIGRRVHADLLPMILLGRSSQRAYAKPFGYAGDFETISLIYQNQPTGVGCLAALIGDELAEAWSFDRARRDRLVSSSRTISLTLAGKAPHRARSAACVYSGVVSSRRHAKQQFHRRNRRFNVSRPQRGILATFGLLQHLMASLAG